MCVCEGGMVGGKRGVPRYAITMGTSSEKPLIIGVSSSSSPSSGRTNREAFSSMPSHAVIGPLQHGGWTMWRRTLKTKKEPTALYELLPTGLSTAPTPQ